MALLTLELFKRAMPQAGLGNINKFLPYLNIYLEKYKINTPLRLAAFIANVGQETGDLTITRESYLYNIDVLTGNRYVDGISNYTNKYPYSFLLNIVNQPTILDIAYGGRMGNAKYPATDGSNYRGAGLLQLTGKTDFKRFSSIANYDFVLKPDVLATNPEYAVWSACWEFGTKPGILAACDSANFKEVVRLVNGGYNALSERIDRYNIANAAFKTGVVFSGGNQNQSVSKSFNSTSEVDSNSEEAKNLNFDFSSLVDNLANSELENTDASWGNRTTAFEESDYIGLKQFLLYLTTRFYPKNLVPFVELIPYFTVKDTFSQYSFNRNSETSLRDLYGTNISPLSKDALDRKENPTNPNLSGGGLIDESRYNTSVKKLMDLMSGGGADLTTIDPFEEFTSSLNIENQAGLNLEKNRNLTYRVYGSLLLNPGITDGATSKPGAVGLRSLEVMTGSQEQHGMSLITVKIMDVQGNKLLDPNSPWSFILNARAGELAADFYFRFGWQLELPDYNSSEVFEDIQAEKFWKHPGWRIFSTLNGEGKDISDQGKTLKTYLSQLSKRAENTITLTQSISTSSFSKPGFKTGEDGATRLNRQLDELDYYSLTMIQNEIDINPQDGSIEATLFFRTKTAVANCLIPLYLSESVKSKVKAGKEVGYSGTFTLINGLPIYSPGEAKGVELTLAELMIAFVQDNTRYSSNDSNLKGLRASDNTINYNPSNIGSWLTVIGGAGTDSLIDVDPSSIIVKISSDYKNQIINATVRDNRLLIEWLNKVLNENNLALLTAATYGQNVRTTGADLTSGFVICYDSEKKSEKEKSEKFSNRELSQYDPSFGDFLNYVDTNTSSQNFIGKRLENQDDVFSMRFEGSLVEELKIEKSDGSNQSSIMAKQNGQEAIAENEDIKDVTDKTISKEITLEDKKRNFNIIYSSMLGLKVSCICHPWIKLGRQSYVKGTGIFDGKYMVTKVVHKLSENGKFTTELNACRVLSKNNESKNSKLLDIQERSQNNPNPSSSKNFIGVSTQPYLPTNSLNNNFVESTSLGLPTSVSNINKAAVTTTPIPKLRESLEVFIRELHPNFQDTFRVFISSFEKNFTQYKIVITSGYRTFAEQARLKKQNNGNASPGYSFHNYGMAIDINLVSSSTGFIIANKNSSDETWLNTRIVFTAKQYGMVWGGDEFGSYKDRVHFGFDRSFSADLLRRKAIEQFGLNENLIQGNKVKLS